MEFIFDRKGVFIIPSENVNTDLEELEMELIDGGLEELEKEGANILVYTDFANFSVMQKKIEELEIEIQSAELQRIPNTTKALGMEKAKSTLKMIDKFEEEDDVQNVFHNLEMTDELIQILME